MRLPHMALALMLSPGLLAQHNWQGDISPDFTVTDINGNSHNLYTYLDQGYTVYVEIAATWCSTCWEIHTSGTLDSLYTLYGPGTAVNKVMVLLIESDPNTGLAQLQGNGNTLGDWITGTPYPIIDDASVMQLWQCPGFGHVHTICPNRQVSAGWYPSTAMMWQDAQYCNQYFLADSPNDATLGYIPDYGFCYGPEPPINVRLQNTGTEPLTNAAIETTIAYHQDQVTQAVMDTFLWTGSLATYEYEELTVAQLPLDNGMHRAFLRLLDPDDEPLNNSTGHLLVSSRIAPGTTVTMEILTDDNASDTHWSLRRSTDGAVIQAVSPGTYDNNTTYTYTWSLQDNTCYYLLLQDVGGNGLSDPAYVKLSVNGNVFIDVQDFLFNTDQLEFMTDADVGLQDEELAPAPLIAPNPMTDACNLVLSGLQGPLKVVLMDATGRTVWAAPTQGGGSMRLDRNGLAPGTYLIQVRNNDGQVFHDRLIVQ